MNEHSTETREAMGRYCRSRHIAGKKYTCWLRYAPHPAPLPSQTSTETHGLGEDEILNPWEKRND